MMTAKKFFIRNRLHLFVVIHVHVCIVFDKALYSIYEILNSSTLFPNVFGRDLPCLFLNNLAITITSDNSDANEEELERCGEVRRHEAERGENAGTHASC